MGQFRVGVLQFFHDLLLVGHGDVGAADWNICWTQGQAAFQTLGVQCRVDRVHGLAAKAAFIIAEKGVFPPVARDAMTSVAASTLSMR